MYCDFQKWFPRRVGLLLLPTLLLLGNSAGQSRLSVDELVTRHLASIGSKEALEKRENLRAEGTGQLKVYAGQERLLEGKATFISHDEKWLSSLRFDVADYPAEDLAYDGDETYVRQLNPGERSRIGEFLYQYQEIMREGLLGGTLSTAWPLLNLEERKPKLKYEGIRNLQGVKLHEMSYRMKKGGHELKINLYFTPETFFHAATIYRLRAPAPLAAAGAGTSTAGRAEQSARQVDTIYTLEERYGDFRRVEELVIPFQWKLRLTIEGPEATPTGIATAATRNLSITEWNIAYQGAGINLPLDDKIFAIY